MRKILITALLLVSSLLAQKLEITDFQADLYSKRGKDFSKKINLSMMLVGRDVEESSYKAIDALNVVIGSFPAEDLLTSKGKEAFKKGLIQYASRKYSVEIDEIYIKKLYILESPKVDDIVEALRQEGCCNKNTNYNKNTKTFPSIEDKDDDIIIE